MKYLLIMAFSIFYTFANGQKKIITDTLNIKLSDVKQGMDNYNRSQEETVFGIII